MKAENRDKELKARTLLYHRFELLNKSTEIDGEIYSIENLVFNIAVAELKRTYQMFIESKEFQEKICTSISHAFSTKNHRISEKDCTILMHKMSSSILNMNINSNISYDDFEERLRHKELIIVPIKTIHHETLNNESIQEHIKAISLFDERLVKINPKGSFKNPGLRIYRIQAFPIPELLEILNTLQNSFEKPLDDTWDKELNTVLQAEKINHITKKEQKVGNGSWLTAKMLVLVIAYAILYEYCKSKEFKDFDSETLSIHIAESIYKLFIVEDRNLTIREYLEMHGFPKSHETLSVMHRLDSIKEFLSGTPDKRFPADRKMLEGIYIKSLNWMLADYLKKGDIGKAHALIESESKNIYWNPLIYAAKNGKIVIAEMLGSNPHYINLKDSLGNLPIHYAVINGHFDICEVFVRYKKKNKLKLTAKDQHGNTPLHLAVLHYHTNMIDLLLKHAPELLDLKNDNEETALKLACDNHHISIIKKLLSKGASLEGINLFGYSEEIQMQLKKAGNSSLL